MSDQPAPFRNTDADEPSPFDELLGTAAPTAAVPVASAASAAAPSGPASGFTTVFRGYDKAEVDEAIGELRVRLRAEGERVTFFEDRYRRANDAANSQSFEAAQRFEADRDAAVEAAKGESRAELEKLRAELAELKAAHSASADDLESQLTAATARAASAEQKVQALTEELMGATGESANRHQFEEILRVAEEQAGVLIRNATVQGDRLLEAAREEIENRRRETRTEAEATIAQAQHDAQQARLRIDTELTAHRAQLERETANGAEKVAQAEREAAAIRTEAEKGAAALRSMVAHETEQARSEAEEAVRELRMRTLEFEESLTRRQDDAQQEFLVLHNQAVAHAERITQDANDQVSASLEHAQRVSVKADDFDKLMRAQAQQIEADAHLRANEHMDRARVKAQKIIETITAHSQSVLRDAEDRTRQLRWQQHQLTSFMSEVKELIRPEARTDYSSDAASGGSVAELEDLLAQPSDADAPQAEGSEEPADDADEAEAVEVVDEADAVDEDDDAYDDEPDDDELVAVDADTNGTEK